MLLLILLLLKMNLLVLSRHIQLRNHRVNCGDIASLVKDITFGADLDRSYLSHINIIEVIFYVAHTFGKLDEALIRGEPKAHITI
ncbi:hypothetical protein RO3G_13476 [Rhizopus delemar RA 99-880]|uniref:Uncharacterized protein n=1 Tax=Rhizopus delemar (strain RA 99-880 / ATCC MYA-4621 / FGSC 9543 / NRRL 43880) TaxID=246409 RepID=I1CJY5_RHIO9|nr:hypothetical protein RO3G_13476 [Rhizopus delemar RA 99-880]|eukprot:EIE88765.1 hypothetical protein RO3G_13476 [Rhizopus delemar RA 99-880]